MTTLITGGARSGKSAFAEQLAEETAEQGLFIATLQPFDEEMRERISQHQEDRLASGFQWQTIEEPLALSERLHKLAEVPASSTSRSVVVIDCMTLWLSNWMFTIMGEEALWTASHQAALDIKVQQLLRAVSSFPLPLLIVTNEVGSGIVPEYPLGRRFRDAAGRLNRLLAQASEAVYLVTAGIPVELKSLAYEPRSRP